MRKLPDSFVAVVFGTFGLLALFLHSIYEDLLKSAVLKFFGDRMGMSEAEVMSRLTEMAVPMVAAIVIMLGFYRFLRSQFDKELAARLEPKISFGEVIKIDETLFHDGAFAGEYSFIEVENAGAALLEKCLVKIEAVTPPDRTRQELHRAMMTEARHRDGNPGRFSLGGGERKRISLTAHDAAHASTVGNVYIEVESGQLLMPYNGDYLVELVAIAEIGGAIRRNLRITRREGGRIEAVWVS